MSECGAHELPSDRWLAEHLAACERRYRRSAPYRERLRMEQIQAAYQYRTPHHLPQRAA